MTYALFEHLGEDWEQITYFEEDLEYVKRLLKNHEDMYPERHFEILGRID